MLNVFNITRDNFFVDLKETKMIELIAIKIVIHCDNTMYNVYNIKRDNVFCVFNVYPMTHDWLDANNWSLDTYSRNQYWLSNLQSLISMLLFCYIEVWRVFPAACPEPPGGAWGELCTADASWDTVLFSSFTSRCPLVWSTFSHVSKYWEGEPIFMVNVICLTDTYLL